MFTKKHAICIVAHKNWKQLQDLIETISTPLTEIYLHIDKKSRESFDSFKKNNGINWDNIHIINSIPVFWGDHSQLLAELALFNEVLKKKEEYSYVHLISGQDFPVRPISDIIVECENTQNDYLSFINDKDKGRYERRLKYKHLFVSKCRSSKAANLLRRLYLIFQIIFGVNYLKQYGLEFQVGANWMSITIDSLEYIVKEYPKYQDLFSRGISTEECYKQMILQTKKDAKIVNNSKRFIVFPHMAPNPIVLTMAQYGDIIGSDAFFARKFDDTIDHSVRIKLKDVVSK